MRMRAIPLDTEYTLSETAGGNPDARKDALSVSTNFNWYVRPIAQFLVHNFEETALAFYARRDELGERTAKSRD
jgi:hypothetical protein